MTERERTMFKLIQREKIKAKLRIRAILNFQSLFSRILNILIRFNLVSKLALPGFDLGKALGYDFPDCGNK
jgi:hypothetical protein